jgi:hypothetical protein
MSLYSTKTLEPSPAAEEILAVLAGALADRRVPARHRVVASRDSRSPDEGLAILQAYVAIRDEPVRQAILDLLIAIAGTDPYR